MLPLGLGLCILAVLLLPVFHFGRYVEMRGQALPAEAAAIEVLFSPNGGCTDAILREIRKARKEIRVLAYSFTSSSISRALIKAKRRGIPVRVILDPSQLEQYSAAKYLRRAGVETLVDRMHGLQHNKVIIIDSDTVITGSFNFSKAAEERNAENLLILENAEIAAKYIGNWESHYRHSDFITDF